MEDTMAGVWWRVGELPLAEARFNRPFAALVLALNTALMSAPVAIALLALFGLLR